MLTTKAAAYITRDHGGQRQLLVFTDPAYPDYGLVIPGGTCEQGEAPEQCLRREVLEESGLSALRIEVLLASVPYTWQGRHALRHYYHCTLEQDCPDEFTHTVTGEGGDRDAVVHYFWVDLYPRPPKLGGRLADGLDHLRRHLAQRR